MEKVQHEGTKSNHHSILYCQYGACHRALGGGDNYAGIGLNQTAYSYVNQIDLGEGIIINPNQDFAKTSPGLNLYFGKNFSNGWGYELGYFLTQIKSRDTIVEGAPITTEMKTQGFSFDITKTYGVSRHWGVVAAAGFIKTWASASAQAGSVKASVDYQDLSPRAGAGVEYKTVSGTYLRFMAHASPADLENTMESIATYGLSIRQNF